MLPLDVANSSAYDAFASTIREALRESMSGVVDCFATPRT
jgi:hypothetical protein